LVRLFSSTTDDTTKPVSLSEEEFPPAFSIIDDVVFPPSSSIAPSIHHEWIVILSLSSCFFVSSHPSTQIYLSNTDIRHFQIVISYRPPPSISNSTNLFL
jgi:hypothetical protein